MLFFLATYSGLFISWPMVMALHGSNNHRGHSGGRKLGGDAVQYLRECSDNKEKLRYDKY